MKGWNFMQHDDIVWNYSTWGVTIIGYKLKCQFGWCSTFFKKGHSRPLFLYFRLFNTVDSKQLFDKSLPTTGFDPRTSSVGCDRFTNWGTTTARVLSFVWAFLKGSADVRFNLERNLHNLSSHSYVYLHWHTIPFVSYLFSNFTSNKYFLIGSLCLGTTYQLIQCTKLTQE